MCAHAFQFRVLAPHWRGLGHSSDAPLVLHSAPPIPQLFLESVGWTAFSLRNDGDVGRLRLEIAIANIRRMLSADCPILYIYFFWRVWFL